MKHVCYSEDFVMWNREVNQHKSATRCFVTNTFCEVMHFGDGTKCEEM